MQEPSRGNVPRYGSARVGISQSQISLSCPRALGVCKGNLQALGFGRTLGDPRQSTGSWIVSFR